MSYEPDVHEAQMTILRELLFVDERPFSALRRATDLESDAFNFHLKKLIEHDYVSKRPTGRYGLTVRGKTYANRMDTDDGTIEKQAKLSVVLIVEDEQGRQLFQERLKQPYYGYWGHPTGKIRWGETMLAAAARELEEETGLSADLKVVGLFHKMDYDKSTHELREDKYFCIVHGTKPQGDLQDSEGCHNEWLTIEAFLQYDKRFGNPEQTEAILRSESPSIVETHDYYAPEHY